MQEFPTTENAPPRTDPAGNRQAVNYSRKEWCLRVIWILGACIFRWTPRPAFGLRRGLLRLFGARLGAQVHVHPDVRIQFPWNLAIGEYSAVGAGATLYNLGVISIGNRVTISQGAHLCAGTHDYRDPRMPLLKPPIAISDDAWICADAFVGPGVTVGAGAVVGARAVVMKDVVAWTVVAGNPAAFVKQRVLSARELP